MAGDSIVTEPTEGIPRIEDLGKSQIAAIDAFQKWAPVRWQDILRQPNPIHAYQDHDQQQAHLFSHSTKDSIPVNCYFNRIEQFSREPFMRITPLHTAAANGLLQTTRALIKRGARLDARTHLIDGQSTHGELPIESLLSNQDNANLRFGRNDIDELAVEMLEEMEHQHVAMTRQDMMRIIYRSIRIGCPETVNWLDTHHHEAYLQAIKDQFDPSVVRYFTKPTIMEAFYESDHFNSDEMKAFSAPVRAKILDDGAPLHGPKQTKSSYDDMMDEMYRQDDHLSLESLILRGDAQDELDTPEMLTRFTVPKLMGHGMSDMYKEFVANILVPFTLHEAGYQPYDYETDTDTQPNHKLMHMLFTPNAYEDMLAGAKNVPTQDAIYKNFENPLLVLARDLVTPLQEPISETFEPDEKGRWHHLKERWIAAEHNGEKDPLLHDDIKLRQRAVQQMFRPVRLSTAWHHQPYNQVLRPYRMRKEWGAILPEAWHFETKAHWFAKKEQVGSVVCLSNTESLIAESEGDKNMEGQITIAGLNHCVGHLDYDDRCCSEDYNARSHILSVRYADGKRLATMELFCDKPEKSEVTDTITIKKGPHAGRTLYRTQFYGKNDETVPPGSEADKIYKAFKQGIENGTITLELSRDKLGEKALEKKDIPYIEQRVGYPPAIENINRSFEEYKRPGLRAAVTFNPIIQRLKYEDDFYRENPKRHRDKKFKNEFVDGYVIIEKSQDENGHEVRKPYKGVHKYFLTPDQTEAELARIEAQGHPDSVSYEMQSTRSMDVTSFMYATGAIDKIHDLIRKTFKNLPEGTEERWVQEAEALNIPQEIDREAIRAHEIKPIITIDKDKAAATQTSGNLVDGDGLNYQGVGVEMSQGEAINSGSQMRLM